MKRPYVVVLGSSNTDMIVRVPRLPSPGETVLGGAFFQAPGGKGANQAVAAARAGAHVVFLASVGADSFGSSALALLTHEGIDVSLVRRAPDAASGVALILVDEEGQNLIAVAPGANAQLTPSDIGELPDAVFAAGAQGVFVTQWETPPATVHAGLSRARTAGLATVFNPAPAPETGSGFELSWLALVDYLILNEHEAESLTGHAATGPDDARRAATRLTQAGPRGVIVTLGANGYVLAEGERAEHVAGHRVPAVDTVAAGDTFVGVFACALAEGRAASAAAAWANRASAISVTRQGAQPSIPFRAEIESFPSQETQNQW